MLLWSQIEKSREEARKRREELEQLDEAAKTIGINKVVWNKYKESVLKEEQNHSLEEDDAFIRRRKALAHRWFEYYKRENNHKKKMKLVDQYNRIAMLSVRQR